MNDRVERHLIVLSETESDEEDNDKESVMKQFYGRIIKDFRKVLHTVKMVQITK